MNGEYILAGGSLGIDGSFMMGFIDIPGVKTNVFDVQKYLYCIIKLIIASAACESKKYMWVVLLY